MFAGTIKSKRRSPMFRPGQRRSDVQPLGVRIARSSIPEPNTGCHLWVGATHKRTRYGVMKLSHGYGQPKTSKGAHVVAFELAFGPVPPGLVVDHKCRNTLCVNPYHLRAVTQRVNLLNSNAMSAVNGRKTECKRGHTLSNDNLYVTPDGRRQCRACSRLRVKGAA